MIDSEVIQRIRTMLQLIYNRFCELTGFNAIPEWREPAVKSNTDLLDVPGFVQTDTYSCGYLAGLAVVRAFQPNVDGRGFYQRVKPCVQNGTPTNRLVAALRKSGVVVGIRYRMSYRSLTKNVEAGFPIIVSTGSDVADHWAVVVGVSDKHIYVMGHGNWLCSKGRFTRRQFEKMWCPKGFAMICSGK